MTAGPTPFLKQLAEPDAEALLALIRRKSFPRGSLIMREGSAGDDVMLVLSGRVKVIASGADEREVALALRGPGELVGEMSALAHSRRTATAVAADDDVELGIVSGPQFQQYLHDHPDVAAVVIRSLVRRLTEATRSLVDLATQDSVGRVARRLHELAADHGSGKLTGPLEIELTQDELAGWTGTTRETVSRALRLMRQLGWVATGHRTITVLDPTALRERGGERSG